MNNVWRTAGKRSVIAGLVLALGLVMACDKKKGGSNAALSSATGGKGLAVFPADSDIIGGMNLKKLREFKLFDKIMKRVASESGDAVAKLEKCGISVADLDGSIIFGGSTDSKSPVVVAKGISKDMLAKCDEALGDEFKLSEDGEFSVVEAEGNKTHIAWLDSTTMMVAPDSDKAKLTEYKNGKGGFDGNKDMMGLLGETDQNSAIWIAVGSKALKDASQMIPGGGSPKGAHASISFSGGVKVDAAVVMGSEDEAKKVLEMAKGAMANYSEMPMAKPYMKALTMETKGAKLVVNINLSNEQVEKLAALAEMMMPN